MKFKLIIMLLISIFSNAQSSKAEFLRIPVDKFEKFEKCCSNIHDYTIMGLRDPLENELRIYGYENESNVFAYKGGTIIKILKEESDGSKTILLKSGDLIFVYENLTNVKVNENDKVSENQILGKILTIYGENYLGFEIWDGMKKLDPIKFMQENP